MPRTNICPVFGDSKCTLRLVPNGKALAACLDEFGQLTASFRSLFEPQLQRLEFSDLHHQLDKKVARLSQLDALTPDDVTFIVDEKSPQIVHFCREYLSLAKATVSVGYFVLRPTASSLPKIFIPDTHSLWDRKVEVKLQRILKHSDLPGCHQIIFEKSEFTTVRQLYERRASYLPKCSSTAVPINMPLADKRDRLAFFDFAAQNNADIPYGMNLSGIVWTPRFLKMDLLKKLSNNWITQVTTHNPGVTIPTTYVATPGSASCFHVEDADLCSGNQLMSGSGKVWVIVPPSAYKAMIKLIALYNQSGNKSCPHLFRHQVVYLSVDILEQHDIPYSIVRQQAGDIVCLASRSFHAVYNSDYNIANAVNFLAIPDEYTPADFAAFDQQSVRCSCPDRDNLIFEDDGRALNRSSVKLDAKRAQAAAAFRPKTVRPSVVLTRQRSLKRRRCW